VIPLGGGGLIAVMKLGRFVPNLIIIKSQAGRSSKIRRDTRESHRKNMSRKDERSLASGFVASGLHCKFPRSGRGRSCVSRT